MENPDYRETYADQQYNANCVATREMELNSSGNELGVSSIEQDNIWHCNGFLRIRNTRLLQLLPLLFWTCRSKKNKKEIMDSPKKEENC